MSTKVLLKDHISETHIQTDHNKGGKAGNQLNRIPVPNNQERISKCDICGKMVNRNELDKSNLHSSQNHSGISFKGSNLIILVTMDHMESLKIILFLLLGYLKFTPMYSIA